MNCSDAEILIHALIDGELDARHARDVEAHVAACPACADKLQAFQTMREAIAAANLKEAAPASLRSRLDAALPPHVVRADGASQSRSFSRSALRSSWRSFFGGMAIGTALSAAVAASLVIAVVRNDQQQETASEIVSAHLRSLQPGHLTDVETSDQHTVKPWFNGKLDVAPPVIDLTAQGFTLVGGRLDYINGEPAGSIVYRRRQHIINLFVTRHLDTEHGAAKIVTVQGFNIRHWTADGLDFWAVSDINAGELDEFARKFTAALRPLPGPS
jgi:anti-sigma factor (TIGR02949 family)